MCRLHSYPIHVYDDAAHAYQAVPVTLLVIQAKLGFAVWYCLGQPAAGPVSAESLFGFGKRCSLREIIRKAIRKACTTHITIVHCATWAATDKTYTPLTSQRYQHLTNRECFLQFIYSSSSSGKPALHEPWHQSVCHMLHICSGTPGKLHVYMPHEMNETSYIQPNICKLTECC